MHGATKQWHGLKTENSDIFPEIFPNNFLIFSQLPDIFPESQQLANLTTFLGIPDKRVTLTHFNKPTSFSHTATDMRVKHATYKVWSTDAKVDDISNGLAGVSLPLTTADTFREASHLIKDAIHIWHHLADSDNVLHTYITRWWP